MLVCRAFYCGSQLKQDMVTTTHMDEEFVPLISRPLDVNDRLRRQQVIRDVENLSRPKRGWSRRVTERQDPSDVSSSGGGDNLRTPRHIEAAMCAKRTNHAEAGGRIKLQRISAFLECKWRNGARSLLGIQTDGHQPRIPVGCPPGMRQCAVGRVLVTSRGRSRAHVRRLEGKIQGKQYFFRETLHTLHRRDVCRPRPLPLQKWMPPLAGM